MPGLPPLPQAPLQNNQDRWSQFFQGQGRSLPQVNRIPAQGVPQMGMPQQAQGAPQMGQPMQGLSGPARAQQYANSNGLLGGLYRALRPQGVQGFPRNEQMTPVQAQPQARRGGFFSRRSAY